MTSNALKKIVIVAALLLLAYIGATAFGIGDPATEDFSDARLATALARIGEATVESVELPWVSPAVRLEKRIDGWYANGFRADSTVMAGFWGMMGEAEIRDLAGANPENHSRLGVGGDTPPQLVFGFPDGTADTIYAGEFNARLGSSYLRLPSENEVYLIDGEVRLYAVRTLAGWRNTIITELDASAFQELRILREEGEYTLTRTLQGWETADGSSADSTAVAGIVSELGRLVAERVLPRDSIGFNADPDRSIEAVGADGETIGRLSLFRTPEQKFFVVPAADSTMYVITGIQGDRIAPRIEAILGGG